MLDKSLRKCNNIEKGIDNAKGSLAVDGINVTDEETEVIRRYVRGELTEKEVLEIIKKSVL